MEPSACGCRPRISLDGNPCSVVYTSNPRPSKAASPPPRVPNHRRPSASSAMVITAKSGKPSEGRKFSKASPSNRLTPPSAVAIQSSPRRSWKMSSISIPASPFSRVYWRALV